MMLKRKSYEEINARCDKLEEMGFEIHHNDSHVVYENVHLPVAGFPVDIKFDFSAIGEIGAEGSIRHIIATVADQMYKKGVKDAQYDVRKALGLVEEDTDNW